MIHCAIFEPSELGALSSQLNMAAKGQEKIRDALRNTAKQANDLLRNYRSSNTNNIERTTSHSNGDTASEKKENMNGCLPRGPQATGDPVNTKLKIPIEPKVQTIRCLQPRKHRKTK